MLSSTHRKTLLPQFELQATLKALYQDVWQCLRAWSNIIYEIMVPVWPADSSLERVLLATLMTQMAVLSALGHPVNCGAALRQEAQLSHHYTANPANIRADWNIQLFSSVFSFFILLSSVRRAGCTLVRSPVHYWATWRQMSQKNSDCSNSALPFF